MSAMDIPDSWVAANEAIGDLHDAPARLRTLAEWFDMRDRNQADGPLDDQVQQDLRRWANAIETLLT